tara:strand:- start:682 stop:1275 length:594 start_codon:yes stop_codon:yes gene_type:complete
MKFLKTPIIELLNFLVFFISFFPGKTGIFLRKIYLKMKLKELGEKFYSEIGLSITGHENIIINNNCRFMRYSSINADDEGYIKIGNNISVNYNVNINSCNQGHIEIGNDVLIGQNTVIRSSDHKFFNQNKKISEQKHIGGKIVIGNNVWIGANCVILKNVTIEDNCIIGAGSVITKDIKKNEVVVGHNLRIKQELSK